MIAMSVLSFRCALDFYVNGETNFAGLSYINYFLGNFEDGKSRLMAYQEEKAAPPYKPSTIENNLEQSDESVKLKSKGVSLVDVLIERRWIKLSFDSSVGVYGYMNVLAPPNYYRLMAFIYAAFAVFLLISITRNAGFDGIAQIAITLIGCLITVFISSYLSWTYAFQPQGRYLFPAIAMIAVLAYSNRRHLSKIGFAFFILCGFMMSFYSFVFIALSELN